jgi:hypothetical protein
LQIYRSSDLAELQQISAVTTKLQNDLWSAVAGAARTEPTPVAAVVVAGMNDVLNSQGYTQAAWRNRVPVGARILMIFVAVMCNVLLGVSERRGVTLLVLPVIISIPLFLIAGMDSPRGGLIHVVPQNLISLQHLLIPRTRSAAAMANPVAFATVNHIPLALRPLRESRSGGTWY